MPTTDCELEIYNPNRVAPIEGAMVESYVLGAEEEAICERESFDIDAGIESEKKGHWYGRGRWLKPAQKNSLDELFSSVPFPPVDSNWTAKYWAFAGLGCMVSVGYMDPGNWSTDLVGGARYGYTLLFIILLSNVMAMFLQCLSLKLGVATERDLAQACHDAYPTWVVRFLWVVMELAIAATDLAEVIGSATALYLLCGMPMWLGVLITALDVFVVLIFGTTRMAILERIVFVLVFTIAVCFAVELSMADPDWLMVLKGYIPDPVIVTDTEVLYIAIGIIGATVMPHNLFLHSAIIQTRDYPRTKKGMQVAIKYGSIDVVTALLLAFYVNSAILILAAAVFHYGPNPNQELDDINQAYELLSPALGSRAAQLLFGISLLASGQSSSITGTLAGQIVMGGLLDLQMPPWVRRFVTRAVAVVPAAIVAAIKGSSGTTSLLVLSQVILSLTLFFAVLPLAHITCSKDRMGDFVNGWAATITAGILTIIVGGLNCYLVGSTVLDAAT